MKTFFKRKESLYFLFHNLRIVFSIFILLISAEIQAEGSINLYPSGSTQGSRAYLVSSVGTFVNNSASYPFQNLGDHFVYVRAGETLRAASSAQGYSLGQIIFTAPDGTVYSSVVGSDNGRIWNRNQEINGAGASTSANGQANFTTFNQVASGTQQGIWKVQFYAPGGRTAADPLLITPPVVSTNGNWTQNTTSTTSVISAWDVSVVSSSGAVQRGRTYVNQLNLVLNSDSVPSNNSFYGIMYTVTKDGYLYRVKSNGYNGKTWIYFVNDKGIVNSNNTATYKSLNSSSFAQVNAATTDPRTADDAKGVTHKMFYVRPDTSMPVSSVGAVPGTVANTSNNGGTTWLNPPQVTPQISTLYVEGVEGTVNQMATNKGVYIKFTTNLPGTYNIKINASSPANFSQVTLTGPITSAGEQVVYWNGKDGAGVSPVSGSTISVDATLNAGEVHFPYVDVELNPNGIIIERLDGTVSTDVVVPGGDVVYWDDSNINGAFTTTGNTSTRPSPIVNLNGISSNTNGHKWGQFLTTGNGTGSNNTGTGAFDFGNQVTLDTWSYVRSTIAGNFPVVVAQTDLEVISITTPNDTPNPGSTENYTVVLRNNGPYIMNATKPARFALYLPTGFDGTSTAYTFNGNSCGSELTTLAYNNTTNTFNSQLALPVGCSVTYTIGVHANSSVPIGTYDSKATILRPHDVYDLDGTNPSVYPNFILPENPFQECSQWTTGTDCTPANTNNIKIKTVNVVMAVCYEDPAVGAGTDSKMGITLLNRVGDQPTEWPAARKAGHLVLESNTKGFVINRLSTAQMNAIKDAGNAVDGMLVYDTNNNCLSIYADGQWSCFNKATCP